MIVASSLACKLVVVALEESRLAKALVRLFLTTESAALAATEVLLVEDEPPEEKKDAAGGSMATR